MAIDFSSVGLISIGNTPTTKVKLESNGVVTYPSTPVFYGGLGASGGSNYFPALSGTTRNITLSGANSRLTVEIAGFYHVHCQQLIVASGQVYLHIRKNGASVSYAYANNYNNYDMVTACDIYLNVGDYIDFWYGGAVTTAYTARHTSVAMYLIG